MDLLRCHAREDFSSKEAFLSDAFSNAYDPSLFVPLQVGHSETFSFSERTRETLLGSLYESKTTDRFVHETVPTTSILFG